MNELRRLLRYVRPYLAPLLLSVILMALVGAAQGFTALLITPVFDRVLNPASADTPVPLFIIPLFRHKVYLQDFLPAAIHNVWTMVAVAIVATFFIKGTCDYFGNYFINYVGISAVTDLRQTVFDKVLRQDAHFFESNSTGRVMSSIMNDIEKIQVATSHMLADLDAPDLHRAVSVVRGHPKGLAARPGQLDAAAVRAGAHHAHRAAHPPHHPPGAG